MAKELAHFKNFAKLKDTQVAFNDMTVIAGKPGTGKSYVMKFMYAMEVSVNLLLPKVKGAALTAETIFNRQKLVTENIKNLEQELEELSTFKKVLKANTFKKKLDSIKKELEEIESLSSDNQAYSKLTSSIDKNPAEELYSTELRNILNSIFNNLSQISKEFSLKTELFDIKYDDTLKVNINISRNKDKKEDKSLSNAEVIFVETPLILEFKKFMKREAGKTPYHIESLLNILDTDYSFTDEEQDKFIKDFTQKSKEIIKGDIESSGDSFIFNKEDDKNYDIVNASSGTKSIGLLQYLVTNKALKKGSVLYWEEPEVHLHPEWQLRMVDLFIELMNAGVKIVFSTHSPFMADYLNALSKREKFQDRISFNVFQEKDGVVNNYILDDDNWNILQSELMDSFEDILWTYL